MFCNELGAHEIVTHNHNDEIASCLAYTVLRNPDEWIGCPSTVLLEAFLAGARFRRDNVGSSLPESRISGVLDCPSFYKQFVNATGHPTLTIRWATAIEMTHHSFAEGFNKLKEEALAWHREKGIVDENLNSIETPGKYAAIHSDQFWNSFASRPGMYMGNESGWTLYCFLNGMQSGGDWLGLPEMPRLDSIFGGICAKSERAYGSKFAAFRVYNARGLLEWVGLPVEKNT